MAILQVTSIQDQQLSKLSDLISNPIYQIIAIVLLIVAIFGLFYRLAQPYPVFSAVAVFRDNDKAELSGKFEWQPNGWYKHLETGAEFNSKDLLYFKDKKSLK